jgi:type IV secretory pathway VirB10-like protein
MQKLLPIAAIIVLLFGVWLITHAESNTEIEPITAPTIEPIKVKPRPIIDKFKPKPKPEPAKANEPPAPPVPQSDNSDCVGTELKQYTPVPAGWSYASELPKPPCKCDGDKCDQKPADDKSVENKPVEQDVVNPDVITKPVRKRLLRR